VIGDTGVPVPTHIPVGEVRENWQKTPEAYEALFDEIKGIVGGNFYRIFNAVSHH
jgi:mevalonate kinase